MSIGGLTSGLLCMIGGLLSSAAPATAQSSSGATHLLVVTGAGGEPAYRAQFHALGARLTQAATARLGVPAANVVFLSEDSLRAPANGRSSRVGVERAIADLAGRARVDDRVIIVLIGHGSSTGGVARFNLPGPDINASELATLLKVFGARTVAVVNTASASGDWVPALSGPGRVVITATRSGHEANATIFPRHFVDALAGDGADADKDGAISLLEAFDYARREVARVYEADNRLLTEHAVLDDDGDGKGVAQPAGRGDGDGALARRVALRVGAAAGTVATGPARNTDPRVAGLLVRRDSLQRAVEALRARKAQMSEAKYEEALERVLLSLATLNRDIRALDTPAAPAPVKTP